MKLEIGELNTRFLEAELVEALNLSHGQQNGHFDGLNVQLPEAELVKAQEFGFQGCGHLDHHLLQGIQEQYTGSGG